MKESLCERSKQAARARPNFRVRGSRDMAYTQTTVIVRYSTRVNVERRYSRGSWQSLLVVTPLFAAAEMRRQMTEAGARVRARLWPFVAEFLSDVQLSLRFNSLSSTGAGGAKRICVTRNSLSRFTSA